MKRGSQIGLTGSAIMLMAAGVTNMCSAVAREEPVRSTEPPVGRAVPAVINGMWMREYRDFMPRFPRRMERGDGGDFSWSRDTMPRFVQAASAVLPSSVHSHRTVGPRITLTANDAPVVEVLKQLFTQAQVPYAIDPHVSGRITYHGAGIPFRQALHQAVNQAAPALSFHISDGIYVIEPRGGYPGVGDFDLVASGE
jgi:hypothetical protein